MGEGRAPRDGGRARLDPRALPPVYEHTPSLLARAAAPGPMASLARGGWADIRRRPTRAAFALRRRLRAARTLRPWERRLVAAGLWALVRHAPLLAAAGGVPEDDAASLWEAWLLWQGLDPGDRRRLETTAPALREAAARAVAAETGAGRVALLGGLPVPLAARLVSDLGEDGATSFALACHERPAVTLRVNRARATAAEAIRALAAEGVQAAPHPAHPAALTCARVDVWRLRATLAGLVDVQDPGSLLVADAAGVRAGDRVVDLCAGAGGKTLGLAEAAGESGRVWVHDTREERLSAAEERCARAGLAERVCRGLPAPDTADVVLVDAPCTGSGTLRRDPTLRWRLATARVERAAAAQRSLLDQAATLVRAGGRVVFATCSVFRAEGPEVIGGWLAQRSGWEERAAPLTLRPDTTATDGFFVTALQRPAH